MLIQKDVELRKLKKVIHFKDAILGQDEDWIAWWYCGINKNLKAASQPLVVVSFKKLRDGMVYDDRILQAIPITAIGQVRLGTVWRNSISRTEVKYDSRKFIVDFSQEKWRLSNFEPNPRRERAEPFPQSIHTLDYKYDKNWLLEFPTEAGGTLVIPCLEFFGRCFGRSGELRRVLTTYPWAAIEGGAEGRLYLPTEERDEDGKWKVKLARRMVNDDVVFLAHAKYDSHARRVAKSIYAQIENQYNDREREGEQGRKPIFIKIEPWFQGRAEIRVRGISFNDGKSFLGLQILGCSEPWGVPIERSRVNPNLVNVHSNQEGTKNAWAGVPVRVLASPPDIINLTADVDPSHSAATIEVDDPDFEVLGKRRVVIDVPCANPGSTQGAKLSSSSPDAFSTGDPSGSKEEVGYVAISAQTVLESHGALRDMWNALVHLSRAHPELVGGPEWFTPADGFRSSEEPQLIPLRAFHREADISTAIRHWPYLNPVIHTQCRGILVARINIRGTYVHFIEIQRRPRHKSNTSSTAKLDEEPFRGFVFVLRDETVFYGWLNEFLYKVRLVQGVVQKLVHYCPGVADTFNHTQSGGDPVPYITTVKKALRKVERMLQTDLLV